MFNQKQKTIMKKNQLRLMAVTFISGIIVGLSAIGLFAFTNAETAPASASEMSKITVLEAQTLYKNYSDKRKRLGIKKYILFKDSEFTRKNNKKDNLTEFKFLKDIKHFESTIQIYDNKVSFLKFVNNNRIGIIMQDKEIYETFKALFDNNYKNAAN